jgi:hypothetical protein
MRRRYLRVPLWFVLFVSGRPPRHPMGLFDLVMYKLPFRTGITDAYGQLFP